MLMKFDSLNDNIEFEKRRKSYYNKRISTLVSNNYFAILGMRFKDKFFRKDRELKQLFDNYEGGYWIGVDGALHTLMPFDIFKELYNENEYSVFVHDEDNGTIVKVDRYSGSMSY